MTVGKLVFSSGIWSIATDSILALLRIGAFAVYALLMPPEDFGIAAFCLIWINYFTLLIDNSLAVAYIREPVQDSSAFDTAFYSSTALGIGSYAMLFFGSDLAAEILHDHRVATVLSVMALTVALSGISSTFLARARRSFEFRKLLLIRVGSTLTSVSLGIGVAIMGWTYWALVLASVSGSAIQLLVALLMLGEPPGKNFCWQRAKTMYAFAAWSAIETTLTWACMWASSFFLGWFLGLRELGLYRMSAQLSAYGIGMLIDPLLPVFYSAYCHSARNPAILQKLFLKFGRMIALVAPLLAAILIQAAGPLTAYLGPRWDGAEDFIILNAVVYCISYLSYPAFPLLRACGHFRSVVLIRVALLVGQVALAFLTIAHGVVAYLWGIIGLEVAIYILTLVVVYLTIPDMSALSQFIRQAAYIVVAVLVSAASNLLAGSLVGLMASSIAVSAASIAVLTLVYCLFALLFEWPTLKQLRLLLRSGVSKNL